MKLSREVIFATAGFVGSEDGYEVVVQGAQTGTGTDVLIDVGGNNPPETWIGIALLQAHSLIRYYREHGQLKGEQYKALEETLMVYMVQLNDKLEKTYTDMGLVQ